MRNHGNYHIVEKIMTLAPGIQSEMIQPKNKDDHVCGFLIGAVLGFILKRKEIRFIANDLDRKF